MLIEHSTFTHKDATTTLFPLERASHRWLGWALVMGGGLADGVAGWFVLSQDYLGSLLIHLPAILAWGIGLGILLQKGDASAKIIRSSRAPEGRRPIRRLARHSLLAHITSGWTPMILLLGLVAFPGLTPLVWCLGFSCVYIRRHLERIPHSAQPAPAPDSLVDEEQEPRICARTQTAHLGSTHVPRIATVALVDMVRDPDVEVRRRAVVFLARQADGSAVRLIQSLLKDDHPDVRSDASVALSHVDASFSRAIKAAETERATSRSADLRYADLCYRYATSSILDEIDSRLYLIEARTALSAYLARESTSGEAWVLMARIRASLNELSDGWHAVTQALDLNQETPEAFLLEAEIAFQQHNWGALRAVAQHAIATMSDHTDGNEGRQILQWWAEAAPR